MFKKLLITSFSILSLIVVIYPSKRENTKVFDYCYSLEKILSKNTIQTRNNISGKVQSISKDIAKFGVRKTKGALINKMIDQYKTSKNYFIINLVPNEIFCLAGYWIELIKPGTFESIFYQKSKQKIDEFKDIRHEVEGFLKDINTEYENIKGEFEKFI